MSTTPQTNDVVTEKTPPETAAADGHAAPRQIQTDRGSAASPIVTVIEPPSGWLRIDFRELWRYRDLFTLFVRRDIVARYRQSVAGIGWAVIRPVTSMLIFTFVFSRVAGIRSDGSPYPLFAFTALLPWMYFSGALNSATTSVVSSGALLKKVYFPRLLLPMVGVVTGLMELLIQLGVLGLIMVYYGHLPGWQVLLAPAFVLAAAVTALAAGLWLTALNVKYRDVGQMLPFLTQAWMWLSPIVYTSSAVPDHLRVIYGLNPMVGVIEGFRWCFLGTTTPDWSMMGVSFGVAGMLMLIGLFFFQRTEHTFADIV